MGWEAFLGLTLAGNLPLCSDTLGTLKPARVLSSFLSSPSLPVVFAEHFINSDHLKTGEVSSILEESLSTPFMWPQQVSQDVLKKCCWVCSSSAGIWHWWHPSFSFPFTFCAEPAFAGSPSSHLSLSLDGSWEPSSASPSPSISFCFNQGIVSFSSGPSIIPGSLWSCSHPSFTCLITQGMLVPRWWAGGCCASTPCGAERLQPAPLQQAGPQYFFLSSPLASGGSGHLGWAFFLHSFSSFLLGQGSPQSRSRTVSFGIKSALQQLCLCSRERTQEKPTEQAVIISQISTGVPVIN